MNSPLYKRRVVDSELESHLASVGAVLIEGPRASGKTATARQRAESEVLLDVDDNARKAIQIDPSIVLEGDTPRLIDEWQIEPSIWNYLRREVDERRVPGQFILTGSAQPTDDVTRHTGAGRISRLRMRPMTFWESGISSGEISLSALIEGVPARSENRGLSVSELVDQIVRGGWPGFISRSTDAAMRTNRAYLDEIRRTDVNRVDDTRRDPTKVGRLMRALARATATTTADTTLAGDLGTERDELSRHTVRNYTDVLTRLHVIEDQPAWGPHLRTRSILRRSHKRHFVDPSLAAAALGASPERLLKDLSFLGFLFESLVVRDLRVYSQPLGGTVYHYQDNTGLEADAILQLDDGRWIGFEMKLGVGSIDGAANNLTKLSDRVEMTDNVGLAVIVPSGYGYVRSDGVYVIPIDALGP